MIGQKNSVISFMVVCSSLLYGSKTTFIPRLITTDEVFELALTNYNFRTHKDTIDSVIAFKPFYQRSHAGDALARFFLPSCKTCSTVREDGTGDINPLWFNLISSDDTLYSSTLCLQPRRTSGGMVLTWYATPHNRVPKLWFGLNTAVVHTSHNLHVQECKSLNPGILPGFTDLCNAFNNPDWTAGRLCCGSQGRIGVDDIQVKVGYDCVKTDDTQVSPYLVGTIPTGKRPSARYVFEPLVGSRHGSIGLGLNMDFWLSSPVSFMVDAKYNYFFPGRERRSFDLCNGDWSRYLLVVTQNEPYYTYPGINSFTKEVQVTPGQTLQVWSAFHYDRGASQLEIGYNFWLRTKEKVCRAPCARVTLPCTDVPIGIADLQYCTVPVTTAHRATIHQSINGPDPVVNDAVFTPTTIDDLNVASGTNTRAVSNTLYASYGYQLVRLPMLFALNGSYEFSDSYGAVSQYALWASLEIQF